MGLVLKTMRKAGPSPKRWTGTFKQLVEQHGLNSILATEKYFDPSKKSIYLDQKTAEEKTGIEVSTYPAIYLKINEKEIVVPAWSSTDEEKISYVVKCLQGEYNAALVWVGVRV